MATKSGAARKFHGMSQDKRYWRWQIMHNRCYNKKNQAYASYGGRGIQVEWVWHRDNPDGMYNFLEWIENELRALGNPPKYIVILNDRTMNYSPENCSISTQQVANQRRDMNHYTPEQVVEIRRYARANPTMTLTCLVAIYGGTTSCLSQALTGTTFSNVDAIEPPIPYKQRNVRLGKTNKNTTLASNASIFSLAASLETSSGE